MLQEYLEMVSPVMARQIRVWADKDTVLGPSEEIHSPQLALSRAEGRVAAVLEEE